MAVRLIDLQREIHSISNELSSIARELNKDGKYCIKVKHFSEKSSHIEYTLNKCLTLCSKLDELKEAYNTLISSKDMLLENYNACLTLLKASNFKHSIDSNWVYRNKINQDGKDAYISTDEYDLVVEMGLCMKYLSALGVSLNSTSDITHMSEAVRLVSDKSNMCLVSLATHLGVKDIHQDEYTILDLARSLSRLEGLDNLTNEIFAKTISNLKEAYEDTDKLSYFEIMTYFITSKYAYVNNLIRKYNLSMRQIDINSIDVESEMPLIVLEDINAVSVNLSNDELNVLLDE